MSTAVCVTLCAGAAAQTTPVNIITDPNPTNLSGRGTFGGLVIDGFARVNSANAAGETTSEVDRVLTDGFRSYGGRLDTDNSGSIRLLVIAESGVAFRPDEEIQGLTLEGVGSGTRIQFVQVLGSEDDGVEWFGGSVNADHLVINGADDDSLDMDLGYRGRVQYALALQGTTNGNYGIESDGNGDNFNAVPFTAPRIANVTILGNKGRIDENTTGALHREGWRGQVYRSVYANTGPVARFEDGCLDIDDLLPTSLRYRDAIFGCAPPSTLAAADETPLLQRLSAQVMFRTPAQVPGYLLSRQTFTVAANGAPATRLPLGFQQNSYYGAVDPDAIRPWWTGWTAHVAAGDGTLINRNIHPLANNVGNDLTPSPVNRCRTIDTDFRNGGRKTIFGESFPVCVVRTNSLSNQTGGAGQQLVVNLTNDHVYVLSGFVNVGDDGTQGATPATATRVVLSVEEGTQIYGDTSTDGSLVITRGSDINVNGTRNMPVVMSGATTSLTAAGQ
ncbi:MAG: hypothetical protein ACR2KU_10560 [Gammaproteobacteria bacterium]